MTAAPAFAPAERYDATCSFCGDGTPTERYRGKAGCAKCMAAIREAFPALPSCPLRPDVVKTRISTPAPDLSWDKSRKPSR